MKNAKRMMSLVLVFVFVFTLSSCGKQENEKRPLDNIVIGTSMEIKPDALIPSLDYNFEMLCAGIAMPSLIGKDAYTGEYYPILCSWESDDSLTWKLKILDGISWSNGKSVTASDIKLGFSAEEKYKDMILDYQTSDDSKTLIITLKEANARFVDELTTVRPQSMEILFTFTSSQINAFDKIPSNGLWCGPYMYEAYHSDSNTISFVKNEYWPNKDDVAANSITVQMFNSEDAMYMALMNGDIDFVWNYSKGTPKNYIDVLRKSDTSLVEVSTPGLPAVLCFNNGEGIFTNKHLRLAISYALDYSKFSEYLAAGSGVVPSRGVVNPSTTGYVKTESLSQNLSKFEEEMKLAKYTKNGEGKYLSEDGKILSFSLLVNSSKTTQVEAAEIVKTQLEAVGIEVDLQVVDSTAYNAKISNKYSENRVNYEAAIMSFTNAGMSMGAGLGSIYVDKWHPVQGACQVSNNTFREIINEMNAASTTEEYLVAADNLQKYYESDCPLLPLYWDEMVYAVNSGFKDVPVDLNMGINNVRVWSSDALK